uniref:Uncharacterized protein n=1 Tax=Populus trichocarpa TaxID=3694 RepID=A0A2K1XCE4_POPTR
MYMYIVSYTGAQGRGIDLCTVMDSYLTFNFLPLILWSSISFFASFSKPLCHHISYHDEMKKYSSELVCLNFIIWVNTKCL